MYEFSFSTGRGRPRHVELFFLPEKIIPDEFYTTMTIAESFERSEFTPYRIVMDAEGGWVQKICDIVMSTPQPRKPGTRPQRKVRSAPDAEAEDSTAESYVVSIASKPEDHGRHTYSQIMTHCQRQCFDGVMEVCARR